MDIEKLIEQYRQAADKWEKRNPVTDTFDLRVQDALRDAATALSTLQAENENLRVEAEGMRSNWYKSVEEIKKLRAELENYRKGHCSEGGCAAEKDRDAVLAELEQVKRERDALIEDFVDYVTGGVPNPAIFCKNRCDKCTDMRGWCTGKNCNGFYPSGASGQKEG